jgi:hypothetical protein
VAPDGRVAETWTPLQWLPSPDTVVSPVMGDSGSPDVPAKHLDFLSPVPVL